MGLKDKIKNDLNDIAEFMEYCDDYNIEIPDSIMDLIRRQVNILKTDLRRMELSHE